MPSLRLLITCEHAANRVPPHLQHFFSGRENVLFTHSAFDLGARELARFLAERFAAPCYEAAVTRLVVDLNRSAHNQGWLSFSRGRRFEQELREDILERYYHPFRQAVAAELRAATAGGLTVLHLSVHSFTPELNGRERRADVALLYDPGRPLEKRLARQWLEGLRRLAPALRLRRNYPYRGISDGHTRALRQRFSPEAYLGIELEINQRLVSGEACQWPELKQRLADSLAAVLARGG